jgi:hypothetical protein
MARHGHDHEGAPTFSDSEVAEAAVLFSQVVVDHYISLFRGWIERRSALPEAWHEAAGLNDRLTFLAPDELRRIREAIDDLLAPYEDRLTEPSRRPEGSRLVSVVYAGIPLPEDHV